MNKNKSTLKLLTSFIDLMIVLTSCWNLFHALTNLITLKSLNILNAEIAPPASTLYSNANENVMSAILTITTNQSNILNLSLRYPLIPWPSILIIISDKNIAVNNKLEYSCQRASVSLIGYLSIHKIIVLINMAIMIKKLK